MINKDFYFSQRVGVFCPNINEFLFDFIYNLGYSDSDFLRPDVKIEVLEVIELLLSLDLIYVYKWYNEIEEKNPSLKGTLEKINRIWFEGATYPDFYNMVIFGSTEWYVQKLENLGMTQTSDWQIFVANEIGDLQSWIYENKPIN